MVQRGALKRIPFFLICLCWNGPIGQLQHAEVGSLRRGYKILLLIFTVLGVYYPAIFSGYNVLDDIDAFGRIEDAEHLDILRLFTSASGAYYRPLALLTFYADKVFWALEPSFMHLENIFLHMFNAICVFLLAEIVFEEESKKIKYELPLLSGLLFALHPINTE